MKLAITGVSGYIGRLFAERVIRERVAKHIVGIDLAPSSFRPNELSHVCRDVRDPALARDLAGCDTVVHFAFVVETLHDKRLVYDVNLGGTRNLLRACEQNGISTLIVASSVAAYGVQGERVIDEDTPCLGDARSFYAHTKRLVEEELDLFAARNPDVRLVRIRPSVVLGPRCNTWALAAMAELGRFDTRRGMRLPVIHEDDVVEAFYRALVRPVKGPLLVAHREPLQVRDVAPLVGRKPRILPARLLLALGDRAFALGLTRMSSDWLLLTLENSFRFDPTRTETELGLRPEKSQLEALGAALANARRVTERFGARTDRLEGTRYTIAGGVS